VIQLQKYITEHVTLFSNHMVIIPLGRTVTLALPRGVIILIDTFPVKTGNFWQLYKFHAF